jgi:hypothetical protein
VVDESPHLWVLFSFFLAQAARFAIVSAIAVTEPVLGDCVSSRNTVCATGSPSAMPVLDSWD